MEKLGHWGCALGKDILFLTPSSLFAFQVPWDKQRIQPHAGQHDFYFTTDPKQQTQITMD